MKVRRLAGADAADWEHLAAWFVPGDGRPARLAQRADATAAVVFPRPP